MKQKVVITDWGFASLEPERKVFASLDVELMDYQCKTEEEVADAVADADVILVQWAPVKRKALDAMRKCKGIVRYGIGLDNIDLVGAKEKGIPVRNVPDYCLQEVADHAMSLALSLQRQVVQVDRLVRTGVWKITPPLSMPPLRHSVLGLVGFGRIAQLVAERAKGFEMRVIASDPFVPQKVFDTMGVEKVPVDELLKSADIVSLHCPLTDETRHLMNANSLKAMKSHALLVNTSRGGLINTQALVEALNRNAIAGAGLDVFEQEPLPLESDLYKCSNVVITSHNAWYSSASVGELQRRAALAAAELLGT
jgi:D-3-phosphoglycerate dehydrogenase / 2-oxoglutarate reductase